LAVPRLTQGRVVLRAFRPSDVGVTQRAAEDPYIRLLTGLEPGDVEGADAYLRRQALRSKRGLGASFAIADVVSDRLVGQIGLWLRGFAPDGATGYKEEAHGRAALGYWVAPGERGKGYATDALNGVSAWALERDDVHRLELFIEPSNEPSWRAAERARYHREGLLRSWQMIGDTRRDMYVYSRLPED
jgi:ribosomal-protein-alanine N-acetyltransferase